VSGVDVAPTLLHAAGLPIPEAFEGRPLPVRAGDEEEDSRTLVAEHRARAAIVVGSTYYARDRTPVAADTPDEITGGTLLPLPPRVAQLPTDGSTPEYRSAPEDTVAHLESLLTPILASSPESQPRVAPQLTETEREALDALGYLE
jgi:hypothetical protein